MTILTDQGERTSADSKGGETHRHREKSSSSDTGLNLTDSHRRKEKESSSGRKKLDDLKIQKMLLQQYQQSNAMLTQNINALYMLNQLNPMQANRSPYSPIWLKNSTEFTTNPGLCG